MRNSEKHAEEKTLKLLKLKQQWEEICESEKKSIARNKKLLKDFEDLEAIAANIAFRTEKLRILKDQYRTLLASNAKNDFEGEKYSYVHPRSSTPFALSSNNQSEAFQLRNTATINSFTADLNETLPEPSVRRKIPSSRSAPGSFCSSVGKPTSVKNLESQQNKNVSVSQSDPYSNLITRLRRLEAGGKAHIKSNITSLLKHEVSQNTAAYFSNVSKNELFNAQKASNENTFFQQSMKPTLSVNQSQETHSFPDKIEYTNNPMPFSHNFVNKHHNLNEGDNSVFLQSRRTSDTPLKSGSVQDYSQESKSETNTKILELLLNNEPVYNQINDSKQQNNEFLELEMSDYRNSSNLRNMHSTDESNIYSRYRRNSLSFAKPTHKENADVRFNLNAQRKLSLPITHSSLIRDENSDPYRLSLTNSNINLSSILSNISSFHNSKNTEMEISLPRTNPLYSLIENSSDLSVTNSPRSSLPHVTENTKREIVPEATHAMKQLIPNRNDEIVPKNPSHSIKNSIKSDDKTLQEKFISVVNRNESSSKNDNSSQSQCSSYDSSPKQKLGVSSKQNYSHIDQAVELLNVVEKNQHVNHALPSFEVNTEKHEKKKENIDDENLNINIHHFHSSDVDSSFIIHSNPEKNESSTVVRQNMGIDKTKDEKQLAFHILPEDQPEKLRDSIKNIETVGVQDYSLPQRDSELADAADEYQKENPYIDKKSEKEQINNQSKFNNNKIYTEKAEKLMPDSSLSENDTDQSTTKFTLKNTKTNKKEVSAKTNDFEVEKNPEKALNEVGDNLNKEIESLSNRRVSNTASNFENSSEDEDSFFDQKIKPTAQNAYKLLLQASAVNQNVNDDSSGDDIENEVAAVISDNKVTSEIRTPNSRMQEIELQTHPSNDMSAVLPSRETTEIKVLENSESASPLRTTPARIKDKIKKSTILSFGLDSESDVSLAEIEGGKGESDKDDFSFYD